MSRRPAIARAEPEELSTQLLAATLAHELNNIVASLRGFIELGAEQAREQADLQRIFGEVRLGTGRAAALAAELEVLAGRGAGTRPTPLLQCLATAAPQADRPTPASAEPVVRWDCDPQTVVRVDPVPARHASVLLRRIGIEAGGQATTLRGEVAAEGAPTPDCASCRAPVPARSAWLIQALPPGRSRQPVHQTGSRQYLSAAQWRLAVFAHAAHAAGGHVVVQAEPESLALVLPLA